MRFYLFSIDFLFYIGFSWVKLAFNLVEFYGWVESFYRLFLFRQQICLVKQLYVKKNYATSLHDQKREGGSKLKIFLFRAR